MPQWAGSSWYFLRYTDPHNANALADMDKLKYWMPVDWYNGGMEHVTRHMIYSRFWHHFLYDLGVVNTPEPYAKRSIQGLILGPDGDKMSKSKGNVVDPLDIVEEYGADTLRTYVLFMGDYGAATPWSENSVKGCKKFLDRVAGLTDILSEESVSDELEMKLHRTIKKVSSDIENLKFNTAIASLMTLINEITAEGHLSKDDLTIFIKLISISSKLGVHIKSIALGQFQTQIHTQVSPRLLFSCCIIRNAGPQLVNQADFLHSGSIRIGFHFHFHIIVYRESKITRIYHWVRRSKANLHMDYKSEYVPLHPYQYKYTFPHIHT